MSVLSKLKGFFSRHRNKFIVGGVLITGTIFLSKYAQQRLRQWHETETKDFLERTRKQNHFESIGRTCNQTILNLSATLLDSIAKAVNTDEVVETLKSNPGNKLDLWNNLKGLVFVKVGCIIYSSVMLVVMLRIQLNIIGGYLYRDPNSITTELQEKYLSLCQNFLNGGINQMVQLMETEVQKITSTLDLKKQLKLSDLEAIFWSMQTSIASHDNNPIDKLREYFIPVDVTTTTNIYERILADTSDFLDSDEVKSISTHCINRGFVLLGDQLSEFYVENNVKITELTDGSSFQNPFDDKKPLAKLIPIINGLLTKQSFPSSLVQQLIANEKLQVLGANIYESLL